MRTFRFLMNLSVMENMGNQLREARKQKGLSQAEIASKLHLRRASISEMERGVYRGVIPPLLNYVQFLGLTLELSKVPSEFPQLSELDSLFDEDNP